MTANGETVNSLFAILFICKKYYKKHLTGVTISVMFSAMKNDELKYFNIETLARMTDLTRRTIRYYVQRGLLQKPEGGGRGHYYTNAHLDRINEIKRLSNQGVPLEKIKEFFSGDESAIEAPSADMKYKSFTPRVRETHWKRVQIGPDAEFSFRSGTLSEKQEKTIKNFIVSVIAEESEQDE